MPMRRNLVAGLVVSAFSASLCFAADGDKAAPPVLSGNSSKPQLSVFTPGEEVELNFSVTGLPPQTDDSLKLLLTIKDEKEAQLSHDEIPITGTDVVNGLWKGCYKAPGGKLGFYRVYASLSNGIKLASLGGQSSRPEGFITYSVVPDPAQRPLYPQKDSFFLRNGGDRTARRRAALSWMPLGVEDVLLARYGAETRR